MPARSEPPAVQLRDVEADDLPFFFENQRDPVSVAMVAYHSRERAAFDEHWAKTMTDTTVLKKTIIVASAVSADPPVEQIAGNINSRTVNGKREVGYWLGRAFWGRGIATAALTAFLRLEQTRPLYASAAMHNAASLRVLQKCGFTISRSAAEPSNDTDVPRVHLTLITSAR